MSMIEDDSSKPAYRFYDACGFLRLNPPLLDVDKPLDMDFRGYRPLEEYADIPRHKLDYGFPIPRRWIHHHYSIAKRQSPTIEMLRYGCILVRKLCNDVKKLWPEAPSRSFRVTYTCYRAVRPSSSPESEFFTEADGCPFITIAPRGHHPPKEVILRMADFMLEKGIKEVPGWYLANE
ncbi:hypothetical protein BXZ70DRAFT_1063927 [Cristinia sonorae]|uniref:Uncharacterized protein n=1 Tax=Cristinia sonorae TaxID=1940300 RepID=A0A8K0UT01_9AGAR|nr:hypothetical protein BXZ70DRAFT_1063927 [Cristinia sonorae]